MSLKATLPALFALLLLFPARPSAQVIIEDADPGVESPDDDVLVIDPDSYGSGSEPILVVPFAASSASSAGLAGLLEQYIIEDLNQFESFAAISLDSSPPVEDVSASLYYAGCPEGDERGCQLVLGELARVSRVVSGTLHTRDDRSYSVEVVIFNVGEALVELSYSIELVSGEEELLPQSVRLALRELLQSDQEEELERQEAQVEIARRQRIKAASEEEAELLARMVLDVSSGSLDAAQEALREQRQRRISEDDIREIKSQEGAEREWVNLGLTERQYISYRNSRLEFDDWHWRWSGHRFQLIGSVYVGFAGGATGLRYYGNYLLDPELSAEPVDSHSWQVVDENSTGTLGASIGFGVLRNLDVELGMWWTRSKVNLKLVNGRTIEDGEGGLIPDPENREPRDFAAQSLSLLGGELMARFYLLNVFPVRPSIGAGLSWLLYPTLYNDPDIPDAEESPPPSIASRYETWPRLVDVGLQIEPGVTCDFGRHFGLFVRVPITVGLNPGRRVVSNDLPRPIIASVDEAPSAPFGTIRILVGVQGRAFGKRVKLRVDTSDDDLLEEDE